MGLRSDQASDSTLLRLVSRGSVGGRPHVVIVGAGFGGLTAAKGLAKAAVEVTLIDRENHHLSVISGCVRTAVPSVRRRTAADASI